MRISAKEMTGEIPTSPTLLTTTVNSSSTVQHPTPSTEAPYQTQMYDSSRSYLSHTFDQTTILKELEAIGLIWSQGLFIRYAPILHIQE
ncbi:unnamed protein product [Caretta caretta]